MMTWARTSTPRLLGNGLTDLAVPTSDLLSKMLAGACSLFFHVSINIVAIITIMTGEKHIVDGGSRNSFTWQGQQRRKLGSAQQEIIACRAATRTVNSAVWASGKATIIRNIKPKPCTAPFLRRMKTGIPTV